MNDMKPNENLQDPEVLEVIEALLDLCMDREKQIAELVQKVELLEDMLAQEDDFSENQETSPGKLDSRFSPDQGFSFNVAEDPYDADDSSYSILLAVNSRVMLRQLKHLVNSMGHSTVSMAYDSEELMRRLENSDPDLITIDDNLLNPETMELISHIRNMKPNTKIVVISGSRERKTVLRAIQSGANDYITKPIQPTRFLQVVGSLLDQRV